MNKVYRRLTFAVTISLAMFMSGSLFDLLGPQPHAIASARQPEYAKWGQIAMAQTKAKYQADIVDYLHVGRNQISPGVAEEIFKLWLRDGTREYGVRVTIQFYTANDRIRTITFQETTDR
jgi:hypothetical protein